MVNYKMCNFLKTDGRRTKRTEMWDSGILVTHVLSIFDPVVFNVILSHSVHLSQNGLYLENGW